jgi:hypothetical protein
MGAGHLLQLSIRRVCPLGNKTSIEQRAEQRLRSMTEIGLKADRQLSDQRVRKAERQLSVQMLPFRFALSRPNGGGLFVIERVNASLYHEN